MVRGGSGGGAVSVQQVLPAVRPERLDGRQHLFYHGQVHVPGPGALPGCVRPQGPGALPALRAGLAAGPHRLLPACGCWKCWPSQPSCTWGCVRRRCSCPDRCPRPGRWSRRRRRPPAVPSPTGAAPRNSCSRCWRRRCTGCWKRSAKAGRCGCPPSCSRGSWRGCALWLKYTVLGFYLAWVLVLAAWYVRRGWGRALAQSCGAFLGGMALATAPWVLYFAAHGALADWFTVYFYDNLFLYSGSGGAAALVQHLWWAVRDALPGALLALLFPAWAAVRRRRAGRGGLRAGGRAGGHQPDGRVPCLLRAGAGGIRAAGPCAAGTVGGAGPPAPRPGRTAPPWAALLAGRGVLLVFQPKPHPAGPCAGKPAPAAVRRADHRCGGYQPAQLRHAGRRVLHGGGGCCRPRAISA